MKRICATTYYAGAVIFSVTFAGVFSGQGRLGPYEAGVSVVCGVLWPAVVIYSVNTK